MKKFFLLLTITIIYLLLTSCFPTSEDLHETAEWSCLINSDGTGFEWLMRGNYSYETFTLDSKKILYQSSDGFYTRDFAGNIEKVSDVSEDVILSNTQQYFLQFKNNEIFRINFDGSNEINLTNTPDIEEKTANFSLGDEKITYSSKEGNLYTISMIDIDGNNKIDVISDSTARLSNPTYNLFNNKIYYLYDGILFLKSINIDGSDNKVIVDSLGFNWGNNYILSGRGEKLIFVSLNSELKLYDIESISDIFLYYPYSPKNGSKLAQFFNNDETIIFGSDTKIYFIDIEETNLQEITEGYSPVISPDGGKIFFIRDRELPVED
ncbi:MAG: hypothetical protein K8S23_12890 [Candidatus Cloacimonetes bacterium]|nr:hypothetical protein [Candidatus Cloacimonadota bacterium]